MTLKTLSMTLQIYTKYKHDSYPHYHRILIFLCSLLNPKPFRIGLNVALMLVVSSHNA
ncbi:rCG20618 [Rattus norvegicus]|uniref:RCG20618 n=1 Tax=Rattus norvegicus TaxID=10116 RepID=A6JDW7_RAT|nr:rCG20618 [Rattus norvegicus]